MLGIMRLEYLFYTSNVIKYVIALVVSRKRMFHGNADPAKYLSLFNVRLLWNLGLLVMSLLCTFKLLKLGRRMINNSPGIVQIES